MANPTVTVQQGVLLGKLIENIHGEKNFSFQGIPYAKPPLGKLRFKAPENPESWPGIRNATKEGNSCYSRNMVSQIINGTEDCLYLNVYTRYLSGNNKKPLPVMVWIHGGGFRQGSGSTDLYGPEYLLTEEVVVVTFNYRLGILGFFSLQDTSLKVFGNVGLKDMVLALRWVQQNISNFGGNPHNVTIFGESAGAAAVHYLVLSPLAKGLFHKAIIQSGCTLCPFATARKDLRPIIARILKIDSITEEELLQLLQEMSVEKLFELSEQVLEHYDIRNNTGKLRVFAPVVEVSSPEAFITEEPIKIIISGSYNKVPLIFGYTTGEGMLITMMTPKNISPSIPQNFESLIPFWIDLKATTDEIKWIADQIKKFYYNKPGLENDDQVFYELHGDTYFKRDILTAVYLHSQTLEAPVYLYRMSIETNLNIFKKISRIKTPGVCHGDDIGYLFKTKASASLKPGSLEEISVNRFIKFWTNFAKTGTPNSEETIQEVQWKPVEKDKINFIDIGEKLVEGVNPEFDRMKFWAQLCSINSDYVNKIYK